MQPLTLSFIQTNTHWHDPEANRALFDARFDEVSDQAGVVVLPEMFSTGFTMSSTEVAERMEGETVSWLVDRARSLGKVICGSLVIEDSGEYYNRFLWVTPEGLRGIYDKRHRFRMAYEHEHYSAGSKRLVIEHEGWRICPMVCYDLRFPVWFRNRGDYDLLLCVANWPSARQEAWLTLLKARAIENLSYAVGVNITGTDGNGVAYSGGSMAHGPAGETLLAAGEAPGVFQVTLEADGLKQLRAQFPAWQDADSFSLHL